MLPSCSIELALGIVVVVVVEVDVVDVDVDVDVEVGVEVDVDVEVAVEVGVEEPGVMPVEDVTACSDEPEGAAVVQPARTIAKTETVPARRPTLWPTSCFTRSNLCAGDPRSLAACAHRGSEVPEVEQGSYRALM